MKVGFFLLVAVALCCGVNAFVLNSNTPSETTEPKADCYVQYAQTAYQIGVVGGAKLRFCGENVAKDVEKTPAVSQCAEEELAKITAQLNAASDQLMLCLTEAAL